MSETIKDRAMLSRSPGPHKRGVISIKVPFSSPMALSKPSCSIAAEQEPAAHLRGR